MSKQTALTKAIEAIRKAPTDFNYKDDATLTVDDVLNILTDLLPYEREVIEVAFHDGNHNEDFDSQSDYFTKKFTDNGNEL